MKTIRYLFATLLITIPIAGTFASTIYGYNINDSIAKRINEDIRNNEYGKISGIVILNKNGNSLYENHFRFNNKNTLNQISSVGKSITSILVGIGLEKGYIESLNTPVYTYFPEYDSIFRHDPMKKLITINDLLTQTSGLKWEEWKYPYNYASNRLIATLESGDNWIEHFFNLPVETTPGTKFSYNSLATQVLAEILERTSGISFEELTNRFLFEPLMINDYKWEVYPNNSHPAWGGISLTTSDMAKLGLLVANHGKIRSTTIIDSAWIAKSTQWYVPYNSTIGYAMHWWVEKDKTPTPLIYAAGYGDQYVYIVEDKEIVIAINAQNFTDYQWPQTIDDLILRLAEAVEIQQ